MSDGTNEASRFFTVTITNVNERPQLDSHDGNASVNLSVLENGVAVTTVSATDGDSRTTLAYSISGGVDASKFRVEESSGVLSFQNPQGFEKRKTRTRTTFYGCRCVRAMANMLPSSLFQ